MDKKLYFIGRNGEEKPKLYAYSLVDERTEVVVDNTEFTTLGGKFDSANGLILVSGRTADNNVGKGLAVRLKTGETNTFSLNDQEINIQWWGSFLADGTFIVPGRDRKDSSRLLLFSIKPFAKPEEAVAVVFEKAIEKSPPPACVAKQVTYPTFDRDPDTNETRQIEAILFTPKKGATKKAGIIYAHGGPSARTTIEGSEQIDFLC